jgi:hypothetical protein
MREPWPAASRKEIVMASKLHTFLLWMAAGWVVAGAASAEPLGRHPADIIAGRPPAPYDYAAKFYPHPAWLYLRAHAPGEEPAPRNGAGSMPAPEPVQRLWFADSHVSAFYAVDETDHRVIVVTEPGPLGEGRATRTEKQLADGERFAISLDGYGRNALTATLAVTRSGKDMDVQITTTPRERSAAGRSIPDSR